MESTSVQLRNLIDRRAWKAEFFLAPPQAHLTTAWPAVPLESIVRVRREFLTPSDYPEREFNFVGLQHVASLTGLLVGFEPCLGQVIRSRSQVFRSGDVLYSRLRPYLNKVYAALDGVEDGVCSGEFYVLAPDSERVRSRFLRWLLASRLVQGRVASLQAGSTHPRLSLGDLLYFEIPLPTLMEQDRLEVYLRQAEDEVLLAVQRSEDIPTVTEAELVRCLEVGRRSRPSARAWPTAPARPESSVVLSPDQRQLLLPVNDN